MKKFLRLTVTLAATLLATAVHADTNWTTDTVIDAAFGVPTDSDAVDGATLTVASGGSLTASQLNVGPTNRATLTLSSGGAISVQTLLATNVVLDMTTNSILNLSGGTLTTSNSSGSGYAANIQVAVATNLIINANWNMNGGTNVIASVQNASTISGQVRIGSYANNVAINVQPGVVWMQNDPSLSLPTYHTLVIGHGTATNTVLTINNGTLMADKNRDSLVLGAFGSPTGFGHQLILTNGGQIFSKYLGGDSGASGFVGGSGMNHSAIVEGANGSNQKATWDLGGDRLIVGGSTGGNVSSNSWLRVGQGGQVTNLSTFTSAGYGSSLIVTNGGVVIAKTFVYIGKNGSAVAQNPTNTSVVVAGRDVNGNPATFSQSGGQFYIGGNNSSGTLNSFGNRLWVGQGGEVTGGAAYVGSAVNSIGNSVVITNGGQMTTTGDAVIGYTTSSHANWISIGGAFGTTNALWDFTTKKLTIGRSAGATGNYATLHSGGVLTNVTTVLLAGTGSRLNFNGGTLAAGADGDLIALDSLGSPVNCTNFVQAGGAVIDTPNFRVVTNTLPMLEDPASAGGGLTKLGNGTLTLNEANTYSGQTTISGGRLALGSTGAINNSSKITIAAGGMFDVSAIPAYTLSSDLSASGTGTVHGTNAAVIVGDSAGSVSFGSRAILLTFTPASLTGDDTSPALVVSQAPLELGGSTLTVTSSSTLGVGDYRLMNATAISGSFSSIDISGVPLAAGTTGTVVAASGGTVTLSVTATVPPSFPPGGVGILPDGNISLTATGAVGAAYSLWASTNVALTPVNSTWTLLDSGTITVSPFTVNDLTATNYPQRFYLFSAP